MFCRFSHLVNFDVQHINSFLRGNLVVVVVSSGRKRPLVIALDFLCKTYRVLLSLSRFRFVVSFFPRPCRSGPSIAFCFAWHLWCHASSSSWFFVFRLSILSADFLFFYCRLSILTSDLLPVNLTWALCVLWGNLLTVKFNNGMIIFLIFCNICYFICTPKLSRYAQLRLSFSAKVLWFIWSDNAGKLQLPQIKFWLHSNYYCLKMRAVAWYNSRGIFFRKVSRPNLGAQSLLCNGYRRLFHQV